MELFFTEKYFMELFFTGKYFMELFFPIKYFMELFFPGFLFMELFFTGFFIPYADKGQRLKIKQIKEKYAGKSDVVMDKQFKKEREMGIHMPRTEWPF